MRRLLAIGFVLMLLGASAAGQPKDVSIDISKGGGRIPIFLDALTAPPGGGAPTSADAQQVLADDLDHSAVFMVTRAWAGDSSAGALSVVAGTWTVSGKHVRLQGEVRDLPARRPILMRDYRGSADDWRALVHAFADDVVYQFTGEYGVARSRIAFAGQNGKDKELYVMDSDGANLKPLTADHSIALSPSWSADGALILFTSYRGGKGPCIYVTHATGGKPYLVSGRAGINTSASYSPDGKDIACTLSQDGNPEIYLLDARGETPRRLTSTHGIDTSPAWSPTGRELAFTSDRGGAPQVYVMDREGGNVRRLTYDVGYTDSPAWSPKGDRIAFVSRTGAGFDIYVAAANGSGARLVAGGGFNENPRWSPDGRHIVFSSNRSGDFALYVSDLDDRPPRKLDTGGMRAYSPAWSPHLTGPFSP